MSKLYAAFGEFEIPVEIGALTCGWMPPLRPVRFKTEPLLGNVAMLKNDETLLVLYSMDLLGMETVDCDLIRREVAEAVGTDYACVSISCTHNHAGPNSMLCDTPKDPQLVEQLRQKMVQTAKELLLRLEPAVMGSGFTYESELTGNRRYVLKDGTVRTHPQLDKVEVLYAQGPIDPVLGVVCVRNREGLALGYLVNFACHPLYYGGQGIASPNYPGELFVKYGMELKVRSRERLTFVASYSNGNVGYLFTAEAQETGGYEPTPVLYSHHDCTAGAAVVDGLCSLLETM